MNDVISRVMKINNAYQSNSPKETELFELHRDLDRDFKKPLDYEEKTKLNGVERELLVTTTKDPNVKKVKSRPYESFSVGGIVDCYGAKWLITELDPNTQIRCSGEMQKCNYTLNFLDAENKPVSYPCYVENYTKYNSGTKTSGTTNQMELGATQFSIKMTFDSTSKILDRTHKHGVLKGKNQRLLIDFGTDEPKAYEITMPDRVTTPGLLILTVTESSDLLTNDDNIEKMIANYYSRMSPSPTPDPEPEQEIFAEIDYSGDPVLFVGGGFKRFTAVFKNKDGEIIEGMSPLWSVVLPNNAFLQFVDNESSGNYIRLKVTNDNMIGVPIRLELTNQDVSVAAHIVLEVMESA